MSIRKTDKEFKEEVFRLVGNEYKPITNYINSSTKVTMKHIVCNKNFDVLPQNFLYTKKGRSSGTRCPYCYGNKKKDTDTVKKEIYNRFKNDYTLLEEYTNNHIPVLIRHNVCGTEFKVEMSHFLAKSKDNFRGCPYCGKLSSIKNRTSTLEEFKEKMKIKYGSKYLVVDAKYINNKTEIKFQHNIKTCKREFYATPMAMLNGTKKCPCLARTSKGQIELTEFIKKILKDK